MPDAILKELRRLLLPAISRRYFDAGLVLPPIVADLLNVGRDAVPLQNGTPRIHARLHRLRFPLILGGVSSVRETVVVLGCFAVYAIGVEAELVEISGFL